MNLRKALAAGVVAIGLTVFSLAGALVAYAEPPVALGSSHVVDDAGVLSDRGAAIEGAVAALQNDRHIALYVVFVKTFASPSDPKTWATTTARQNGLTPTDYLLAVSVNDRSYYLSASTAGRLSSAQLRSIEQNQIEPQLRSNNWSGAGVAAANGLGAALAGPGEPSSASNGATIGAPASGIAAGITVALVISLILVTAVVILVLIRAARRRKVAVGGPATMPATPADELQAMPLVALERRAAGALVATDDAIQASTQELGFAQAEYGDRAAEPFAVAVQAAQAHLREAFSSKQKLDDEVPDTEQERRLGNVQILRLCAEANRLLDEQAKDFAELRAMEKNLPQKIAGLRSTITAVLQRRGAAETTLAQLTSTYSDAALTTVSDNGGHVSERLAFAATVLANAEAKGSGSASEAAVSVRAAEAAIGQANLLLDAIDRVAADLATARGHISELVSNLKQDIADARGLAAIGDRSGAIMEAQRSTQDVVDDVTRRLNGGNIHPRELIQALEQANREIDSVLGAVRTRQAQEQRASASLGQMLANAQARVTAATDFIAARRGAVGAEARTRLAEATQQLSLAQSTSSTNTVGALAAAQRADDLSSQAIQLASNDVTGFASNTGGGMFGLPGQLGGGLGGGPRFGVGGILGAVLGGILIDSVLRGGGQDGGFGGSDNDHNDFFGGGFGGGDNRDAGGGGFFGDGGGGGDSGGGGSF